MFEDGDGSGSFENDESLEENLSTSFSEDSDIEMGDEVEDLSSDSHEIEESLAGDDRSLLKLHPLSKFIDLIEEGKAKLERTQVNEKRIKTKRRLRRRMDFMTHVNDTVMNIVNDFNKKLDNLSQSIQMEPSSGRRKFLEAHNKLNT